MTDVLFQKTIDVRDAELVSKEWKLAGLHTEVKDDELKVGLGKVNKSWVDWEWYHHYFREGDVYILTASSASAEDYCRFADDDE